jgi:pimeloyl-ACP methyl ester carboxylesterase
VYELSALLTASGEKPPYVVVGHSMGGRYVRLFATTRPADVAGVVLVDANHEDDLLFINGTLRREWETATGQQVPPPKPNDPLKVEDLPQAVRAELNAAARREGARAIEAPFTKLPPIAQRRGSGCIRRLAGWQRTTTPSVPTKSRR